MRDRTKAAIYSVVTPGNPKKDDELLAAREFCERNEWDVAEEFLDQDVPNVSRPRFNELLEHARLLRFGVVVLPSLDRLTRTGSKGILQALLSLDAVGVGFISVLNPELNSLSPCGPTMIRLLTTLAELDDAYLSERSRAAQARARADGKRIGRPRKEYSASPSDVRALRAQGLSWHQIRERTGIPETPLRRLAKGVPVE